MVQLLSLRPGLQHVLCCGPAVARVHEDVAAAMVRLACSRRFAGLVCHEPLAIDGWVKVLAGTHLQAACDLLCMSVWRLNELCESILRGIIQSALTQHHCNSSAASVA